MTEQAAALAKHRLARARELLRDGDLLATHGGRESAVNRYYYAAFHAARAVLTTRDADSAKHSGVIALFQRHFVKTGLMDADIARALPQAFEKRQNSDYADFAETTPEELERVRVHTHRFVDACADLLSSLMT